MENFLILNPLFLPFGGQRVTDGNATNSFFDPIVGVAFVLIEPPHLRFHCVVWELCTPSMGVNLWGESPLYENRKVFIRMDTGSGVGRDGEKPPLPRLANWMLHSSCCRSLIGYAGVWFVQFDWHADLSQPQVEHFHKH